MKDIQELFSTGQVFGFPVDVGLVLKHLKQDMRDDWFPDSLRYEDIFSNASYAMETLLKCLNEWDGEYIGTKRVVRPIPKKMYAERYSLETDFFDRFVYQAICTFLIPYLDPLLSHRVLSYRYNRDEPDSKYLFRNKIKKWIDYEGLTYRFIKDEAYLAATDVANFYENVSSDQLISELNHLANICECSGYEKGQIRAAIRNLNKLFGNWSLSGEFGLPQNRDCSSFLSNVLLSKLDFTMQEKGYDYYRYVDDIRIVCKSEYEARKSIQMLIGLLRDVGMNINTSKTTVLTPESSTTDIETLFPSLNSLVISIDNMWKSKSRRIFIKSIEYVIDIIQTALAEQDTQSRTFRFGVNRLSQLIDAGLLDVSGENAQRLMSYAIESLTTDAVSTDQISRLIHVLKPEDKHLEEVKSFLLKRETCIHDWQNYQLWKLLAYYSYKSAELLDLADALIKSNPTSSEAAGIFIWLQSTKNLKPIIDILGLFDNSWPFQNQRYFLFAVSGLPEDQQKTLIGRVGLKLKGTMVRAKKEYRSDGVAIIERERPSLAALYEDIKDYA